MKHAARGAALDTRQSAWGLVLALCAVGFACGKAPTDAQDSAPRGVSAKTATPTTAAKAAPADANAPVFQRSRPMMGTVYAITVLGTPTDAKEHAIQAAFDEIARLEDVLSEWRPTSEISRINAAAGVAPVTVGKDALAVVSAGIDVSKWSGGAFDLSWAALHGLYDFRPGHERVPTPKEIASRLPLIDWQKIKVDAAASTVFLERKGMVIGTGGIGKGYAVDRARDILLDRGIKDFLIFGGGQVTVQGKRGNRPWKVGIQHPRMNGYFAFLEADSGSIGTSGDYEHMYVDAKGKRWHHLIDTRTGYPADASLSVTILAPDGLYADALSKPVFIGGGKKGLAFLAGLPTKVEAVIVDKDFRIWTTPGTEKRLTFTMNVKDGILEH